MKKIKLFVATLAIITAMGGTVLAAEATASLESSAGITPDNAILYPIDKALDNLKLEMTSQDKLSDVLVSIAEERLGESEVMTKEGKTELSEAAVNEYNDKMDQALDTVKETIEKEGSNISKEKLEELNKLQQKIENKQKNSLEVLKNIESKLPEKAKATIAKVIEMQEKKKAALEKIAIEKGILKESKTALQQAKEKLEEAKKNGDAEAIKAAELAVTEQQKLYEDKKTEVKQNTKEIKEELKGGINSKNKKETKEAETAAPTTTTEQQVNTQKIKEEKVKQVEGKIEQRENKKEEIKKQKEQKQIEHEQEKADKEKEHKKN